MSSLVDVPLLLERLGIEARARGKSLWACCPFHDERTPSWNIVDDEASEKHGFWRCYGCGEGGGAVGLAMKLLGVEFGAAKDFVGSASTTLPAPAKVIVEEADRKSFEAPFGVVRDTPLDAWLDVARSYLASRGVTERERWEWNLGYAIDGRLSGRIYVPVQDFRGKLVGYTARSFVGDDRKYLEPNAAEGGEGGTIFGEYWWPQHPDRDVLVVVEGPFDAIAVRQATGLPVAALRGSNFVPRQANKLATFADVIVATDPDAAGEKVARDVRESLARFCRCRRVIVPEGHDVASYRCEHGDRALARILGVKQVDEHRAGAQDRAGRSAEDARARDSVVPW